MKSMTPFQEALLASAESQFKDVPAEDQIEIQPSPEWYRNRPGRKTHMKPFRKAILIAAAVALFAGVALAAHFYTLGKVDVTAGILRCPLTAEEITDGAYVIDIKFREDFSNSDAPDIIETFYLPTLDVCENAEHKNYEVGENRLVADFYLEGQQIHFWQRPAKSVPDNYPIYYMPDTLPEAQTEMLQIGNYEVLSLSVQWQFHWEGETDRHTDRYWYWTNGEYLFQLSVSDSGTTVYDTDLAFMQQLMESVKPIEDISSYFGK